MSTGFEPPTREYTLDFTGTELDGLEVTARSAPIGMVLELGSMVDAMVELPDLTELDGQAPAEQVRRVGKSMTVLSKIITMYSGVLLRWNYTLRGEAQPATEAGMRTLDPAHVMMIVKAWQAAVTMVPAELGKELSSGETSPELSIPMEPLSPNPES